MEAKFRFGSEKTVNLVSGLKRIHAIIEKVDTTHQV